MCGAIYLEVALLLGEEENLEITAAISIWKKNQHYIKKHSQIQIVVLARNYEDILD